MCTIAISEVKMVSIEVLHWECPECRNTNRLDEDECVGVSNTLICDECGAEVEVVDN